MASGRGESGRDSVGDGVPTAKLLLLLLRELWEEENKQNMENICLYNTVTNYQCFIRAVNSRVEIQMQVNLKTSSWWPR